MPAFPAAAILVAGLLDDHIREKKNAVITSTIGILTLLFTTAIFIAPHALQKLRDCPDGLIAMVHTLTIALTAGASIALIASAQKRTQVALGALVATMLISIVLFATPIAETLADHWEEPLKAYAQFAANSDLPIVVYDLRKPSIPFYAKHRVESPKSLDEVNAFLSATPKAYILTMAKNEDQFAALGCKTIAHSGKILFASWTNPKAASCAPAADVHKLPTHVELEKTYPVPNRW